MPGNETKLLVSVVMTFFNEEKIIPALLDRLTRSLAPLDIDYELIFVNDASTDSSLELLTAAAEQDSRIKILTLSRNFGSFRHGDCILAGIEHARGDAVVIMDTDLQDPPELIPDMIKAWRAGDNVDVVYTTRLSRAGESAFKLWVTKWGYKILHGIAEVPLPVNSGDFKLISRRTANYLMRLRERTPFIRGLIHWIGFKQVPIYYHREPRFAGETKRPALSGRVIDVFISAVISFSDVPLKICIFLGSLVALAAFLLGGYAIACKLLGISVPGWSGIISAVLFLGGIQLIMLGVVGLYIGAILDQVRDRPRYILDSKKGFTDERVE